MNIVVIDKLNVNIVPVPHAIFGFLKVGVKVCPLRRQVFHRPLNLYQKELRATPGIVNVRYG